MDKQKSQDLSPGLLAPKSTCFSPLGPPEKVVRLTCNYRSGCVRGAVTWSIRESVLEPDFLGSCAGSVIHQLWDLWQVA